MKNDQAMLDVRNLMTGKDGKMFITLDDTTYFLAEVDTFQVQMNTTNTDYQPVGSILVYAVPTGVSFTISMTEAVVRDDVTMEPIVEAVRNGKVPSFDFQGVLERPDGEESRQTFRNCIPDGAMDLMNLTPGEIIKRALAFRINSVPEFISTLPTIQQ